MSKIRLFVLSFLMLFFATLGEGVEAQEATSESTSQYGCREVQVQCIQAPCPVQVICTEPPVTAVKCSWCGLGCVDISKGDLACAMIAPPSGKSCVNSGGKCTVVPSPDTPCGSNADCGPNSYCYQPPMPSCPPGAACKLMMPSRVCRSCIPRPACLDGVKDATGKLVYCDPKPGVVYCPINRVTPTPVKSCRTNADCGTTGYCYQPPMPECKPGMACIDMMPMPYCRSCTPRLACMDANPACQPDLAPGAPPFCPKPVQPCGFCGTSCVRLNPKMACAEIMPANGTKCVDVAGTCTIQKVTAGLGQACGGISGIMCQTGLRCDYGIQRYDTGTSTDPQAKIMVDKGGICVKDTLKCEWCGTGCRASSPNAGACPEIAPPGDKVCIPENGACVIKPRTPTCIPRPACMDGIKDANGNVVYCDAKPGVVYCPPNRRGDANGDGRVDLVDFAIWKREYISKLIAKADFNKDGKVDLVDFSVWKNSYLTRFTTTTTDTKTVDPQEVVLLTPTPSTSQ